MKQTEKANTKTTPKTTPKVVKPVKVVKQVKPKEEMNYITIYNGGVGKKAKTEKDAVAICKAYIATGKVKKASVYVFVKEIK
jgi:hypothetical protein